MFKKFCKHTKYKIISYISSEPRYLVQCLKCANQFYLIKVKGEMYNVGEIVDTKRRM